MFDLNCLWVAIGGRRDRSASEYPECYRQETEGLGASINRRQCNNMIGSGWGSSHGALCLVVGHRVRGAGGATLIAIQRDRIYLVKVILRVAYILTKGAL